MIFTQWYRGFELYKVATPELRNTKNNGAYYGTRITWEAHHETLSKPLTATNLADIKRLITNYMRSTT